MSQSYDKATAIAVMRALAQGFRNTRNKVREGTPEFLVERFMGVEACVAMAEKCARMLEENPRLTVEEFVKTSNRIFQDG